MRNFRIRMVLVGLSIACLFGAFVAVARYESQKKAAKVSQTRAAYLAHQREVDAYRLQRLAEIDRIKRESIDAMERERVTYEALLSEQSVVVAEHTRSVPQTYVVQTGGGTTTYVTSSKPTKSSSTKTSSSTSTKAVTTTVSVPKPTTTTTTKTS